MSRCGERREGERESLEFMFFGYSFCPLRIWYRTFEFHSFWLFRVAVIGRLIRNLCYLRRPVGESIESMNCELPYRSVRVVKWPICDVKIPRSKSFVVTDAFSVLHEWVVPVTSLHIKPK
jgi:hypothetical protein